MKNENRPLPQLGALALSTYVFAAAMPAMAADAPSFVQDGKLTVCTGGGFPPMEYYENPGDTKLVGIEVDVVEAIAAKWGAEAEYVISDFPGLLPALEAGRCDIVASGMSITPARLEKYDGVSYFRTSVVIVTGVGNTDIAKPEDLSGKLVTIEAGTDYELRLAKLNEELQASGEAPAVVQTYPSPLESLQQVIVGRADATITQDTTVAFRSLQVPDQMRVAYTYEMDSPYGIYLRRNGDDGRMLADAMIEIQKTGAFETMLAKWKLPPTSIAISLN